MSEDSVEYWKDKFFKQLHFVKTVRDAQKNYFELRTPYNLKRSKDLEEKLDKTIAFYLGANENQEKIWG